MTEVDWESVWARTTDTLREHHVRGLEHLITEDVVRFAVVQALVDEGVSPRNIRAEWRPVAGMSVDLAVGDPVTDALEFKYPREPVETNAAWTQHLGEMMKDFFRLATLPEHVERRWCVQVVSTRLSRYLDGVARNHGVALAMRAGDRTHLDLAAIGSVPATARKSLERWVATGDVARALCVRADDLSSMLRMLVHTVEGPHPRSRRDKRSPSGPDPQVPIGT